MRTSLALICALTAAVAACGGSPAGPSSMPAPGPTPGTPASRVLVVTHTAGFRHGSIAVAERTIEQLGLAAGLYQASFCRTADDVRQLLTSGGLVPFDAVVFANTTGELGIPDLNTFLGWIASGRGFVGVHSAADTYRTAPAYVDMLGNEFVGHGNPTEVDAIVETPGHAAVAHLTSPYRVFDEIYRFARNNRSTVTPLLTMNRVPSDGLPGEGQPADLPLAWAKGHGSGRVFYTALGHHDELWLDPRFQQHVLGGIRSVLGR